MTVVRESLTSAAYTVRQAARWTPGWLAASIGIQLLVALNPAVQVQLAAWLVRSVERGMPSGIWPPLILLSAFMGVFLVLGSLSNWVEQRQVLRLKRQYQRELLRAITELPPQRLATEETNSDVQACRGALWALAENGRSAISAVTAVVGAAALCVSVWVISPWAGVLVVLAVVPTIVPVVDELRADNLQVTYPSKDSPALTGFSFAARRGETIALVGINGAGKTTEVNALMGIVDVDHGSVAIDGRDVADMSRFERLGHFGLLTQEFGRYELPVRDSVALGTPEPDVSDEQIWAALDAAMAGDMVRSFPDGLDTQLGTQWGGTGLSGGQWQRIALARIHLRGSGIWLLDEPTSAIDAEAEQEIFAQLRRTAADRITIVVSHRAWTLRGMDRIYVFDDGRVVEEGRYEDLLARGGRFAEIFREQAA